MPSQPSVSSGCWGLSWRRSIMLNHFSYGSADFFFRSLKSPASYSAVGHKMETCVIGVCVSTLQGRLQQLANVISMLRTVWKLLSVAIWKPSVVGVCPGFCKCYADRNTWWYVQNPWMDRKKRKKKKMTKEEDTRWTSGMTRLTLT